MPLQDRLSSLSAKDDLTKSRDSGDGGGTTPDTTTGENQMIQRCVIVQRDDKGYGLTVSGDNPVYVQSVKAEGAAARCGVQEGDKILKVNGTLVTNRNHIDVVKLIKSGPLVALTLLGKPPPNSLDKPSTIITPQHLTSSSNRVTAPQPVDPEKDKELWQQKVHTIQAMCEQAKEDHEKLKKTYIKNPTEKQNNTLLEKERTVKRLEEQLKSITGSGDISPSTPLSSMSDSDKSPMDQNSNTSWRNKYVRHSKQASAPVNLYTTNDDITKLTSVSRSKSDVTSRRQATYVSYIGGSSNLSQPAIFLPRRSLKRTSSLPSSVPTISDAGSLSDSPPTSPSISPTPSHPSNRHDMDNTSCSSSKVDSGIEDIGSSNQTNIITIDDEDINSEEEMLDGKRPVSPFLSKLQKSETGDAGPFSDITTLEKKPAHLGIFLHYLISNSDPSPVFFYIISDQYNHAQGSSKDMRKWAYEIYSTFLAANAPLSAGLGDNVITTIDSALTTNSGKTTNENVLRTVFEPARNAVKGIIQDLLADFRQKKDLGLGSIYGTHELRDDMDKQSESKMIEKYLMNHLSVLTGEDKSDREQAMGWALATFLRQTVTSKSPSANMMERVQSFVMKDKRSIKFPITKTKTKTIKGHQFTLQHYYMVTFCNYCNSLIWGVGYQGYQCNSCEINVHRQCVDDLVDVCTGKQKKGGKRASGMIPVIPSIRKFSNPNPSAGSSFTTVNEALREAANLSSDNKDFVTHPLKRDEEAEFAGLPAGHSVKSIVNRYERPSPEQPPGSEEDELEDTKDKNKKKKEVGRSESMKGRMDKKDRDSKKRSKSDVDVDDSTILALNQSGGSSNSSLGADNLESVDDLPPDLRPDEQTDSDLDVENDLPSLKSIVGEEGIRKLKPKEKKRQEVLNELVHTERAHVRNLKILDKLFFRPMAAETSTSDLAKQLLPNIHSMIRLHSSFNNSLKNVRKENPVIGEVGHIFLKRFDSEEGEIFKNNCATFCRGQSFALDALKKQQRKEQRLSQFLNDAESNPLCRRLQLKDLVPTQFQRLTKYPLLIDNLLKYTQTNTEEYRKLTLAQQKTKEILAEVNQSVKEFENQQRLRILMKKMEKKIPQDSQEIKRKQVHEDMKTLDLPQHKLVYEGELTWRLRPNRLIDMHVILLEDILVLLQKQDEKLILKCQSLNVHNQSDLQQPNTKGYTHSPILKLQNLLSRNVATDKKAFFVINTSEAGPQIYELIASNQTSRKTWHNHINAWADICKREKSQKPAMSSTPVKSHAGVTTPQPEEITEIRTKIKRPPPPERLSQAETNNQDVTPQREDSEILETAQVRTEPELARPTDVKVSNLVVAQSKAVLTPLEQMKSTDIEMNELLIKKEKIVSSYLNFPLEDYRTMSEPSDSEDPDSRTLLAAAIRHMDDFIRLVSNGSDSLVNQPQDSTHSNKGPGVNVPIPMSQLKEMAAKMNSILTNLLSAVGSTEEERDRLRVELKAAQDQLNVLREIQRSAMSGGPCSTSRPASMVSVASTVSEPGETTEGETDDDTAQESDQEMIEHHHVDLMEAEQPDSDHDLDLDPDPYLENHDTDNKQTNKDDEDGSEVDPVYEDAIDKIEAETVQSVNSAPTDSKTKENDETPNDKQSSHVTSDGQVINHVMESENEVVLEQVTMSESCDYENDNKSIPVNHSESLDSSSNEETVVEASNEPDVHSENPKSTNPETPQINSIVDSIEGANFSDSDSTVTPVPFFSEMGDSEIDIMAKSDATLVGSINSILSDTDSSHDPPNSCDLSCDSQRTNENEEPVQSDQSNKPSGIEL